MFEEEIFGENFEENSNDLLNEHIADDGDSDTEAQGNEDEDESAKKDVKFEVKVRKKRNIIRPVERFMGERGLQAVDEYCKGIQFKGKHNEREDLNSIMALMQHWAHRAFPQMKFDDALDVVENLGKKKIIQTHMTKYRLDMLEAPVIQKEVEAEEPACGVEPIDEFDDLLSDQINQMTRLHKNKTSHSNQNQSDISLGCAAFPATPDQSARSNRLTSAQMALIAENRQRALERRRLLEQQKTVDELPSDFSLVVEDDVVELTDGK